MLPINHAELFKTYSSFILINGNNFLRKTHRTRKKLKQQLSVSLLNWRPALIRRFTHLLEDWFPLFPGANGIRAPHHQTLRVDAEVFSIARLQGYPATAKKKQQQRDL